VPFPPCMPATDVLASQVNGTPTARARPGANAITAAPAASDNATL